MGLNINANNVLIEKQIFNPAYSLMNESYYLPALHIMSEVNDISRICTLQLYQNDNYINEEGIISGFFHKIGEIFKGIINMIRKIKDAIVKFIQEKIFHLKKKADEQKKENKPIKQLSTEELISKYYNEKLYVDISGYDNHLNQAFLDNNDPKCDTILDKSHIDKINKVFDDTFKCVGYMTRNDTLTSSLNHLTKEMDIIKAFFINDLTGRNDIFIDDISNILKERYIGNKIDLRITRDVALTAIENFKSYDKLIKDLQTQQKMVKRAYDNLENNIRDIFKKIERVTKDDPALYADMKPYIGADENDVRKTISNQLTVISVYGTSIAGTVKSIINAHMMSFAIKLECMTLMSNQDKNIINIAKNAAMNAYKSLQETDETKVESVDYAEDSFDEYINEFYKYTFLINEAQKDYCYIMELRSLMEADTTGVLNTIGAKIKKIIDSIVDMVQKFLTGINKITETDKKWFDNNKEKLEKLVFPSQEKDFEKWYDFDRDLLNKETEFRKFSRTDIELMNKLESDDEFGKYLFNTILGKQMSASSEEKSFIEKCKFAYSGEEIEKKKIGEVQKDIPNMLSYCMDFVNGEEGSLYGKIQKTLKSLDASNKEAMEDIEKIGTATDAERAAEAETPNVVTPGQNNTNDNTKKESTDFDVDVTKILGLMEVNTPKPEPIKKDDNGNAIDQKTGKPIPKENPEEKEKAQLSAKATRYFMMCGNLLGAKMNIAIKCYNQYKSVLKWGIQENERQGKGEIKNTDKKETKTNKKEVDTSNGIEDAAKKKK